MTCTFQWICIHFTLCLLLLWFGTSHFTRIFQGCLTGTQTILLLPQCWWTNLEGDIRLHYVDTEYFDDVTIWICHQNNTEWKKKKVCIFYRICIIWVLIYRLTSNNQSQSNISFIMLFFVHITTIIEDYNQAFRKRYIYQQSNQPFKPCKISPWNTTRFH